MVRIKKWVMKQQWRIVQIRGIWGLLYGVLILAGLYVEYVPFFADMGFVGPFAFGAAVLLLFLIMGYIYDRVLVMWASSQEVTQERNPYQFIPSPKEHILWFPIYSTILDATERLADQFEVDKTSIEEARLYYAKLQQLRAERKEDIDEAIKLSEEFVSRHPFAEGPDENN